MTGRVPRTTPRSAQEEPRPRIPRFWRPWTGRYAPIGRNRRTTRGQRRTLTRLESDAELLSAENADVLLHWRRLLEFYDHRETRIRATAQVVFADVVDSHRAQQELIELLSWVRDRRWLRLSPEDVDAHKESFMDLQAFLELPSPVRRRMRAERAFVRLEQHFGSQLVEYERNMTERMQQEVGANRAEVTSALEAVAANNAQLIAW